MDDSPLVYLLSSNISKHVQLLISGFSEVVDVISLATSTQIYNILWIWLKAKYVIAEHTVFGSS